VAGVGVGLAIALEALGAALSHTTASAGAEVPAAGQTVVVLAAACLVTVALPMPGLRPLAAATAAVAVLAAMPVGAPDAAVPTLVPCAVLLAASVLGGWSSAAVEGRAYRLLRAPIAFLLLVLVAVGAFMVPDGPTIGRGQTVESGAPPIGSR
jgi:hypothetical protein